MVSIKGIYDGNIITPLEATPQNKSFKVIITFTEEIETAGMLSEPDFNEEEDIYQDYLVPKSKL